ncbi:MAG: alpha/beta hydrolase [Planctomycetota bacterium]
MLLVERTGAGAPVILVHGFLGSAGMWAPVVSHLARSFDVIAIDLPGFGRDTAQTAPDRIEDFARVVIDTVDGLKLGRFHMIGHSMGGMIAQQIALECGSRLMRLVLYGTAGSGRLPLRFESIAVTIARMRTEGVRTVGRGIVRSWFTAGEMATGFAPCAADVCDVTLDTAVAALTAIDRWDLRSSLDKLTMPCLVIGGDADRSTPPEELLGLYRSLPRAELCVLPHRAHAAHLESVDLFNSVVGQFLMTADPS